MPEASASGSSSSSPSSPRLSYEAQKALARQRRKLEKTVQETETEITETEAAIHLLEDRMSTPEGAADATLYDRHARLKAALEDAEARWLEASEALSNLTSPTS